MRWFSHTLGAWFDPVDDEPMPEYPTPGARYAGLCLGVIFLSALAMMVWIGLGG